LRVGSTDPQDIFECDATHLGAKLSGLTNIGGETGKAAKGAKAAKSKRSDEDEDVDVDIAAPAQAPRKRQPK